MRVAIDLVIAEKEPGGMLFATRALLDGLARIDRANEYIIITGRPQDYQALATAPNMRIHPVKLRTWRGILIQHQLLMPGLLRRLQPDVLHVPAFVAPIGWKGPLVLTVHDLAFLKITEQTSLYGRLYWQYLLHESVRRAQHIIVVSEHTRGELLSHWTVERERTHLVYNALRSSLRYDHIPAAEIQAMRQRYGHRYLLHVGRIMPRKNVETLLKAFDLLADRFTDLHLVLAGGVGYDSAGVIQQMKSSPYRERIHLAGWVPEQELAGLYAGASALVFPSKHEGFGLPVVEAMACGTPVVASHEAALLEISGEAVVRTDCSSATPLANALTQVLADDELRARLIRLGRIRAGFFTVEACASATRLVYQEALSVNKSLVPAAVAEASKHHKLAEGGPRTDELIPNLQPD